MITRRDFTKYLSTVPLIGLSFGSKETLQENEGLFYMICTVTKNYKEIREIFDKYNVKTKANNIYGLEMDVKQCRKLDSTCIKSESTSGNFIRVHWLTNEYDVNPVPAQSWLALYDFKKYVEDVKIYVWSPSHIKKVLGILDKNKGEY